MAPAAARAADRRCTRIVWVISIRPITVSTGGSGRSPTDGRYRVNPAIAAACSIESALAPLSFERMLVSSGLRDRSSRTTAIRLA